RCYSRRARREPAVTSCWLPPRHGMFAPVRPRFVLAVWLAALLGAVTLAFPPARGALADAGGRARSAAGLPSAGPSLRLGTQAAPPQPTLRVPAGGVRLAGGYTLAGWALLDRGTG